MPSGSKSSKKSKRNRKRVKKEKQPTSKKIKPSPIIVEIPDDFEKFLFRHTLLYGNRCEFDFQIDKLKILPNSQKDKEKIEVLLFMDGTEYYTYDEVYEKPKKLVLCGPFLDTKDIKSDLEKNKIDVQSIKFLRKRRENGNPNAITKYLVIFPKSVNLQNVWNIKKLCSAEIHWEKLKNNNVTQCYNCQKYGHGANNCRLPPKCVKCAGDHKKTDCPKSREDASKCANCGENHLANHVECPFRKMFLRNMSIQKQRNLRIAREKKNKTEDTENGQPHETLHCGLAIVL